MTSSIESATEGLLPVNNIWFIPVDRIEPNPFQPREEASMTPESLEKLVGSLRKHGILQPTLVRPHPTRKNWFQMVSGERRLRAAQQSGLLQIPATVRELTDLESSEIALQENIQRKTLTDFEEAKGLWKLWQTYELEGIEMTLREMSRRMDVSVSFITNRLDTLQFRPDVQELLKAHRGKLIVANKINEVDDDLLRAKYIKMSEKGNGVRVIEAEIAKDNDEANAEKEKVQAAKDASKAPDSQTQKRIDAVAKGQSGSMSRGQMLTSDNAKNARELGLPALQTLETWATHFTPTDFERLEKFALRVTEGDLSRK